MRKGICDNKNEKISEKNEKKFKKGIDKLKNVWYTNKAVARKMCEQAIDL